jgi:glycosyltransferase involved in cell wall biosynthesis
VDNEYFRSGAEAARAVGPERRRELRLPGQYFLCVARLVVKKNLPALIEAYARYRRGAGSGAWSLVISGSGPMGPELVRHARLQGAEESILFTGRLGYAELPARYGLAGAFVLPSTSEQWGLVVNEAMASGLPVIVSSQCGCAPELVVEGQNGYLVDPRDPAAIEAALGRMAAADPSELERMGMRSAELIRAYSPENFAAGLERAIQHASARSRRRQRISRLALRVLSRRKAPRT